MVHTLVENSYFLYIFYVGIGDILVQAAKNTIFKNHPIDILYDENHLYRIILVHLTSNFAFKNTLRWLIIKKNLPNSKF